MVADEDRDLERQRHPRARPGGRRLDRPRAPGRALPPGNQGRRRPGAGAARRCRRVRRLLARQQGLLRRRHAGARRLRPAAPGVLTSAVRLRDPHRHGADRERRGRLGLRPQRRQGLRRQTPVSRRARRRGRRARPQRHTAHRLRRPQRDPDRPRRAPQGAEAGRDRPAPRRASPAGPAARPGPGRSSDARRIPTTTACSRGGRRGARCASATSAGVWTTSWRAPALPDASARAGSTRRSARATTPRSSANSISEAARAVSSRSPARPRNRGGPGRDGRS